MPAGNHRVEEDGGNCSYSTVERFSCTSETDETGQPRHKCERVRQVLRHCHGRPTEVVESSEEQIEGEEAEALAGGSFLEGGVAVREGFGQPWEEDESLPGFGYRIPPFERREMDETEPFDWKQQPDYRRPDRSQPSIRDFWDVPENPLRGLFRQWEEDGKEASAEIFSELEDFLRAAEGMAQEILGQFGGNGEEGQKGGLWGQFPEGGGGGFWGRFPGRGEEDKKGGGGFWGRFPGNKEGESSSAQEATPNARSGQDEGRAARQLDKFLQWFRGDGEEERRERGEGSRRRRGLPRWREEKKPPPEASYADYQSSFEEV